MEIRVTKVLRNVKVEEFKYLDSYRVIQIRRQRQCFKHGKPIQFIERNHTPMKQDTQNFMYSYTQSSIS